MSKTEYMRVYMLKRYHRIRQEIYKLLGDRCKICGSKDNLEIDHIDPTTKKFNIARNHSRNRKELNEEIAKCQILCKNCHEIKSIKEREVDHGQGLSGKKNCNCNLCKYKKASYMKKYKGGIF